MKRFLLQVFLFSTCILALCIAIAHVVIPDSYIIHKTEGTGYSKFGWNLELINNHPEYISGKTVFFGPSVVRGGICDSTLTAEGVPSLNLGTNHSGNETCLYFLERINGLGAKNVVFHAGTKAVHDELHPLTPLLIPPGKLMEYGQQLNGAFCTYIFERVTHVMSYVYWRLTDNSVPAPITNFDFGVVYEPNVLTDSLYIAKNYDLQIEGIMFGYNAALNDFAKLSEKDNQSLITKLKVLNRKRVRKQYEMNFLNNHSSASNFKASAMEYCKKQELPLSLVYLPMIGDAGTGYDFETKTYIQTDLSVPVYELEEHNFLSNKENWSDLFHLSKQGAISFSQHLAHEIKLSQL